MSSVGFNICPSCVYRNDCVLTTQKDKVWACSEFEADPLIKNSLGYNKNYKHY